MICVSYTRSVSNTLAVESPNNAIGRQNEAIAAYVKKKGWRLTEKYSDRRRDPDDETQFLKMKQDAIDRKFECIVVSSFSFCGKKYRTSVDLFKNVFYPAGVHFAVVQDDFCSAEATEEELKAYFRKAVHEFRSANASKICARFDERTAYKQYGYVRIGEEEMEIDPEAAEVVREIFRLSCEGKSTGEIARLLNERGVETHKAYRRRKAGLTEKETNNTWNATIIAVTLDNRLYLGEWDRCIRGETVKLKCPPLVSREVFEGTTRARMRKKMASQPTRAHVKKSVYMGKIVDLESQRTLHVYTSLTDGSRSYGFKDQTAADLALQPHMILCSELDRQVAEQLEQEKRKAETAVKRLSEDRTKLEKEDRLSVFQNQATVLFMQMAALEEQHVYQAEKEMDGQRLEKIKNLDAQFQKCIDRIKEINLLYSEDNPWISLYSSLKPGYEVMREMSNQYIEKISVYRFQRAILTPFHKDWYDKLPGEWFSDLEVN